MSPSVSGFNVLIKQQQTILGSLASLILIATPVFAKSTSKPLKIIDPDLIIVSAEMGEFLDDRPDPRHFSPSNVVGKKSGPFGWRMKVKTSRKMILIQEKAFQRNGSDGLPFRQTPKFGYLFSAADIVQGVPAGKHKSTVFIENVPIKTFTMTVQ